MEESDLNTNLPFIWPEPLIENFNDKDWPQLHLDDESIEKWVIDNKKVLIRVVTWNLCANPPPSSNDISNYMLPKNKFHVYAIGTEECERSIAQSAINPSKKSWEAFLMDAVGPSYVPIRSHTLQAIHLMVFVHNSISHLCSIVTSAAVPTGIASTLGNKGGVGVYFKIASTTLLIVNAHLAAHQSAELRRNTEFNRINRMIPMLLMKKEQSLKEDTLRVLLTKQRTRSGKFSMKSISTSSSTPYNNNSTNTPVILENSILDTKDYDNNETDKNKLQIGTLHESDTIVERNNNNNDDDIVDGIKAVSVGKIKPNRIMICTTDNIKTSSTSMMEIPTTTTTTTTSTTIIPQTTDINAADSTSIVTNEIILSNVTDSNEVVNTKQSVVNNILDNQSNKIDNLINNTTTNNLILNNDIITNQKSQSQNQLVIDPSSSSTLATIKPLVDVQELLVIDEQVLIEEDASSFLYDKSQDYLEIDPNALKTLDETADFVVFMGDLNYRIKGNRKMIGSLISNNMHDVLINNDQLKYNMSQKLVLQNFIEPPLNFKPTYKYDIGTKQYDTSKKRRIPSWTDRILYVPNEQLVTCIAYNSMDDITTSDHRPVYASFILSIESFDGFNQSINSISNKNNNTNITINTINTTNSVTTNTSTKNSSLVVSQSDKIIPKFTSESQVCSIM